MSIEPIKPTKNNLAQFGGPLLTRWLIEAAESRSVITYGEAMLRLEKEVGFSSIGRATRLGHTVGTTMDRIHNARPDAPLLNVLLVLQSDAMPSDGAASFMAARLGKRLLLKENIRTERPEIWRAAFEEAATEVYAFEDWPSVYFDTFNVLYTPDQSTLSATSETGGTERDGKTPGKGGEGKNHEALRLWVQNNPERILPRVSVQEAKTEYLVESGDRVDVVYFVKDETIALEVKSRDSNEADFKRGIYQCVKYRAVLQARDPRGCTVLAILVTESALPGYLKELARRLHVRHKQVRL